MPVIFLVEHDALRACGMCAILQRASHSVKTFCSGAAVLRALREVRPVAVILNRRLPDMDGIEVLSWIREHYLAVPVLMMGHGSLDSEVVRALDSGADDYLAIPIREPEFVARLKAILRRANSAPMLQSDRIGPFHIDRTARSVRRSGLRIELTPKEFEILDVLVTHVGQVISRQSLAARVWGRSDDGIESRTLDAHIYKLRRKLGLVPEAGVILEAVYGHGYRLKNAPPPEPETALSRSKPANALTSASAISALVAV